MRQIIGANTGHCVNLPGVCSGVSMPQVCQIGRCEREQASYLPEFEMPQFPLRQQLDELTQCRKLVQAS
ncbi:hypothetical protein ABTN45_20720, partial [Acinetobacter baumannii]